MLAAIRFRLRRHHFAWLLALALWLPAAQWAAATHALLHLHASVSDGERDPAPHLPGNCAQCVVAAALGGLAPGPAAIPPAVSRLPLATALLHPASRRAAAAARFYASRAPPRSHA